MIHNERAYEAAKQARIRNNKRKTNEAAWMAAHADAKELSNWLFGVGEFSGKLLAHDPANQEAFEAEYDATTCHNEMNDVEEKYQVRMQSNPLTQGMFHNSFGDVLLSMHDNLLNWGGLSDKQTELVRKALARKREWVAKAEKDRAAAHAKDLKGVWIGEVKVRQDFDLVVKKRIEFDSTWGITYIHICKDADHNTVIYKGSIMFSEGPLKVKATVKEHTVRDGIKQTLITRPKEIK